MPSKNRARKDATQAGAFKATLAKKLAQASVGAEGSVPLLILDEHRYRLLPVIRRCRRRRGVRVHAPYAARYQWVYLYEALEVDSANRVELLFTPAIDQNVHAVFLRQIRETDLTCQHNVIQDQAGFHIQAADSRRPDNLRLFPLPPYSPELNPVEKLDDLVKDAICKSALYPVASLGGRYSCRIGTAVRKQFTSRSIDRNRPVVESRRNQELRTRCHAVK